MDYIATYQKTLNRISRSEITRLVGDLVILNSGVLITDVKQRWQKGQSIEGGIIGRYSWESYRLFKQQMNPLAGGNVDLMLTGALSEGLTVRKNGKDYQIFSTDSKYDKIGKKYGYKEFGVTEQELNAFFDELYEFAFETLLQQIWG